MLLDVALHVTAAVAKKINLVFRATVLKTYGRVSSFLFRIKTSIIKTPTKKKTVFS